MLCARPRVSGRRPAAASGSNRPPRRGRSRRSILRRSASCISCRRCASVPCRRRCRPGSRPASSSCPGRGASRAPGSRIRSCPSPWNSRRRFYKALALPTRRSRWRPVPTPSERRGGGTRCGRQTPAHGRCGIRFCSRRSARGCCRATHRGTGTWRPSR